MGAPITPELLMAGGQTSANMLMGHLTNVKNRKFTREMYKTQRQDALSDWAMQNEYNSPRAQMQRYQEAGLNPHLIYGQSNEGATVRSSSSSGGQAEAPKADFSSYYALRQQSAQTDLVAKQMSLMDAEIELKKLQGVETISRSNLTNAQKDSLLFDLGMKSDLRETTIEKQKTEVDEAKVRINTMLAENLRKWELHTGNLKAQVLDNLHKDLQNTKVPWEISAIKKAIDKIQNEIDLTAYDRKLLQQNINPKNPGIFRSMEEMIRGIFNIDKKPLIPKK